MKPVGEILHGNADLASEAGAVAAIADGAKVFDQAMDRLTDPELAFAEHQYRDRLRAIPIPDAPAPEPMA